jgi:hypothetical protein
MSKLKNIEWPWPQLPHAQSKEDLSTRMVWLPSVPQEPHFTGMETCMWEVYVILPMKEILNHRQIRQYLVTIAGE